MFSGEYNLWKDACMRKDRNITPKLTFLKNNRFFNLHEIDMNIEVSA